MRWKTRSSRVRGVALAVSIGSAACAAEPAPPPAPAPPRTGRVEATALPVANPALPYPKTRAVDVKDTLFGVEVKDPFRWLEDGKSPEVQQWMKDEDTLARKYLAGLPERGAIADRLKGLSYVDVISAPRRRGTRLFSTRRRPDQEKQVLYVKEGKGPEKVLLDPNAWPADSHESLGGWWPSWDGRRVAFGVSKNNADEETLFVLDVATGKRSAVDVIPSKYPDPQWTPSGDGFYYTYLPKAPGVPVSDRPGLAEIRFHRLGEDPTKDRIVHEKTGDPSRFIRSSLSRDGKWLLVKIRRGWEQNDVFVKEARDDKAPFRALVAGAKAHFWVEPYKDHFYVVTDDGAPRFRAFSVDARHLERAAWREILPERKDATLEGLDIYGGRIVARYVKDATARLESHDLDGKLIREIKLPGLGSVSETTGLEDDDTFYYAFDSFTTPPQILSSSVQTGASEVFARVDVPVDPSPYAIDQVFFPSKDGTRIAAFIVHRKDAKPNRTGRVLLEGYGGFLFSYTPEFSPTIFPWLERGGVYALATLRGGGEYGEEWHKEGMLLKKQNVFDDFIAAAGELVKRGWTSPGRIATIGRSNGGLLVGATMVQRPDLFGAALCGVPLLDMVRYDQFGSGKTWRSEYGSSEDPVEFKALYAYSPYHHVATGAKYPALLLTSADADDRVDPMHARKFAAAVQAASAGGPALLRIEQNSGHFGADLVKETVERTADMLAFALAHTR